MNEFCKEKGFSAWFETSAKENVNVEEATRSLINEVGSILFMFELTSIVDCFRS